MTEIKLIEKKCENPQCQKVWRQLETDKQKFHSKDCEEQWQKHTLKSELPPKEKCWSKLDKSSYRQNNTLNTKRKERNSVSDGLKKTPRESVRAKKDITSELDCAPKNLKFFGVNSNEQTQEQKKKDQTIGKNTDSRLEEHRNYITSEINKSSIKGQQKDEEMRTLPPLLPTLYDNLREERSTAIQQLNYVGECLLNEASEKPQEAIKALTEFRNVMKVKLDYMRFGVELAKNGE